MPLTIIDRFHPRLRRSQQADIDAGQLQKREELELLDPEQMRPLVMVSLQLLIIGGVFFVALNLATYIVQTHTISGHIDGWGLLFWFICNVVAYILVLPLHEGIHGFAFAFWGGRPYFGAKLPIALYCGAKHQLFPRNYYLVVGLAPLVVITLAGIILTILAPDLAAYTLFGTIGNVSGAAGDVWAAREILRLPKHVFIEDTETGYRVWEIMKSDAV